MKNLLTIFVTLISLSCFGQKDTSYKREIDSLAKKYKVKNACGMSRTIIDNGIVPIRESVIIFYKTNKGEIKQQFLYTRDL
jgi:hypothetical protein